MTTKTELLKHVRKKCLDCCVYQAAEVNLCAAKDCELWPFRMGKDPNPARKGNPNSTFGRKPDEASFHPLQ